MLSRDKTCTLHDAVAEYVRPGQTIALEGFGHLVPMAAAHEIARQRLTHLTLARMSCDLMIDELLVAGCLDGLITSFVGNSSGGSLHELRRRVEGRSEKTLILEEYSHGGMIARYMAGAAKLPFHAIKSYAGSDVMAANPHIRSVIDPYSGHAINVVPALNPDVSIIHAQRADRGGNIQAWGILGIHPEVAFAGKRVVVTVEQIVGDDVIRTDPNRTIVPAQIVDAVVECPGGAYPSSVQGFYDRDDNFFRDWSERARSEAALIEWVRSHILASTNHDEFLSLLGRDVLTNLQVDSAISSGVNYGRRRPSSRNPI